MQVETTVGQGSYTEPNGNVTLTGLVDDKLNIMFSNTTPSRTHAGDSNLYDGKPVSVINVNDASTGIFVSGFWSPTLLHEEGHAFRGDLGKASGFFRNMAADFHIDSINFGLALKDASSIQTVRQEAETGLDYFGARYFSGAQGRFTTPDRPQPGVQYIFHHRRAVDDEKLALVDLPARLKSAGISIVKAPTSSKDLMYPYVGGPLS